MISLAIILSLTGCLMWYSTSKYYPKVDLPFTKPALSTVQFNVLGWLLILVSTTLLSLQFNIVTGIIVSSFLVAFAIAYWMLTKPFLNIAFWGSGVVLLFCFFIEILN